MPSGIATAHEPIVTIAVPKNIASAPKCGSACDGLQSVLVKNSQVLPRSEKNGSASTVIKNIMKTTAIVGIAVMQKSRLRPNLSRNAFSALLRLSRIREFFFGLILCFLFAAWGYSARLVFDLKFARILIKHC